MNDIVEKIEIFHANEMFDNPGESMDKLKQSFRNLPVDRYLERQLKIEYLKSKAVDCDKVSDSEWLGYYIDNVKTDAIKEVEKSLAEYHQYENIKSYRRRAMASFEVVMNDAGAIHVARVPSNQIKQGENLRVGDDLDLRTGNRVFDEMPDDAFSDDFIGSIKFFSEIIFENHPELKRLRSEIHFTKIIAQPNTAVSNSPEGIHQDGIDYIVSAFVVERKNITGGDSIVYQGKEDSIFSCVLQEGQLLFQPDRGTNLWHAVKPITAICPSEEGYRCSVGYDFII